MAIVTKRTTNDTPDGVTELFAMPEEFVSGSVWVVEVDGAGSAVFRTVEEMGPSFIKLTPAPANATTLYITYEVTLPDLENSLGISEWDQETLSKIIQTIVEQQETIASVAAAVDNRLTYKDYDTWASVIERKLKSMEERIALL